MTIVASLADHIRKEPSSHYGGHSRALVAAVVLFLVGVAETAPAANIAVQAEAVSVPYSNAARSTPVEIYLKIPGSGTAFLAAHQVRAIFHPQGSGAAVNAAGPPTVHLYAGPNASPATAVAGNRVDSGDVALTGAVVVASGSGLVKILLSLPPRLPVGFYPIEISADPRFTFLADSSSVILAVDAVSGGLTVRSAGVAGDYDGDGNVDGIDLLRWQRNLGSRADLTSDGNGDGVVDGFDLVTWSDHWGSRRTAGDFDYNRFVDGADLLEWQRTLGSTTLLGADADANGRVEAADLSPWRTNFGMAPPPGDYSADGTAPGADLLLWQRRLDSTTILTADGNENGVVDSRDPVRWRTGFRSESSVGTSLINAVPEPSSLVILLTVATSLCARSSLCRVATLSFFFSGK